ncbi:hypothetical protein MHB42_01220 [Lysinibacillus sp. FSL K6-0232]|uniref:hypothetical protein n=1 Tax=unclassified Lysinibacillus TaxID=2636778 RepID=UPI0030FBDEB6
MKRIIGIFLGIAILLVVSDLLQGIMLTILYDPVGSENIYEAAWIVKYSLTAAILTIMIVPVMKFYSHITKKDVPIN